jgi:hypothetical protein
MLDLPDVARIQSGLARERGHAEPGIRALAVDVQPDATT